MGMGKPSALRAYAAVCLIWAGFCAPFADAMPGDYQPGEYNVPAGPPVPGGAVAPVIVEKPLAVVEAALIERGRLKILAARGSRLQLKNRFILSNPSRLILDIADAKLGSAGLPFPPGEIGGIPINTVRLGQFTEDTVRVVIETPETEHFQVSLDERSVLVLANRPAGLIGGLYQYLFKRNEPPAQAVPQPAAATNLPPSATARDPSVSPVSGYPQLDNLRRLQEQVNGRSGASPSFYRRDRIIEVARSQVGLSKDTDPDYVMQTFSQGRDTDWCADFVSTIMVWAGGSPWGHLSRVQDIYQWGLANRQVTGRPEPASLVIFSNDGKSFSHIAFVESVNPDNTITTIGGNEGYAARAYKTSGSVTRSVYKLADKRIVAFVDPVVPSSVSSNPPGNFNSGPGFPPRY